MGKNRVFILGAGFSAQAGMPVNLTDELLNYSLLRKEEEFKSWLEDLNKRICYLKENNGDNGYLNIEQLFDYAVFDIEFWKIKHQLSTVGRNDGLTDWNFAKSINTWLGYIRKDLTHVIGKKQQEAQKKIESINSFTSFLSKNDIVITYNYDTLVETSLATQKKKWNHGLNDKDNDGIPVLKMHGSVDWVLEDRDPKNRPLDVNQLVESGELIKLYSKTNINKKSGTTLSREKQNELEYKYELWRHNDVGELLDKWDRMGNILHGIVGLGRYKPLHELPGSGPIWHGAFKALGQAEEIYVIGFSMSEYDTMTRFHFTSVIHNRNTPPVKVIIIDPDAEKKEFQNKFIPLFGKSTEFKGKKAEDVIWAEELDRAVPDNLIC